MHTHDTGGNAARTVTLAAALVLLFGGLGVADGIFARLEPEVVAALAAFGAVFAAATYALDGEVRAWARALLRKSRGASPAARRAAPSAPRTSARGADAARVPAAD